MSDKRKLIKSVATGTLCGLLTGIILMCVFAVVMLKTSLLPSSVLDLAMAGVLGAGAFVGGFVSARMNRGAGLIVGALTGAVMLSAIVLTSAFSGKADFSMLLPIKLAASLTGGALGGILAVREKKKIKL